MNEAYIDALNTGDEAAVPLHHYFKLSLCRELVPDLVSVIFVQLQRCAEPIQICGDSVTNLQCKGSVACEMEMLDEFQTAKMF